jgi:hypothetical protein
LDLLVITCEGKIDLFILESIIYWSLRVNVKRVVGPASVLRFIVVDEEHTTRKRYSGQCCFNGRDVIIGCQHDTEKPSKFGERSFPLSATDVYVKSTHNR